MVSLGPMLCVEKGLTGGILGGVAIAELAQAVAVERREVAVVEGGECLGALLCPRDQARVRIGGIHRVLSLVASPELHPSRSLADPAGSRSL